MKRLISTLLVFPLLAAAPRAIAQGQKIKWDEMDLGPFFSGCYAVKGSTSFKGVAVAVGTPDAPATMLFDTELLRMHAAWEGGLARFPRGRGGLEGQIKAAGDVVISTGWWTGWGKEVKADPRPNHQGAAPGTKWQGIYVNGDNVVLSYSVGKQAILELPGSEVRNGRRIFTRTFSIAPGSEATQLLVGEAEKPDGASISTNASSSGGQMSSTVTVTPQGGAARTTIAVVSGAPNGVAFHAKDTRIVLGIPPQSQKATFQVAVWSGPAENAPEAKELAAAKIPDVNALTKPGPARWGAAIESSGTLGKAEAGFAVDDIPFPENNPWKSWFRPGGHDFFPDGRCAVVNLSGDVFIVSGLDEKLEKVQWRRFASGLFQPLGCVVADGKVYVLGRDQITRLHDTNNDGEADFYENFNSDCVATDNYHEFALDLVRDSKGNFYYAKGSPWTPTVTSPHQGCLLKVSKDGKKLEVVATGLRAPNGLGIGPNDELTVSDNQGHWMPANRLNLVKPGGFYGMVPAAHRVMTFKRKDGTEFKANPSTEEARREFKTEFWGKVDTPAPTEHDLPLAWIPMSIDNSPGGEVWVPKSSKPWAPLAGHMLHLSYGKCTLFSVLQEKAGGQAQGGFVKFPLRFTSGIQRGRFSPTDGQLYVTGLSVWQSSALRDGCFQRVRATGEPVTWPIGMKTTKTGIELTFTNPLDKDSATDSQNFSVEHWNYNWTGDYGSADMSVQVPGRRARDLLLLGDVVLSEDRRTLTINADGWKPAMQVKVRYRIKAADGSPVNHEIHLTLHQVPGA